MLGKHGWVGRFAAAAAAVLLLFACAASPDQPSDSDTSAGSAADPQASAAPSRTGVKAATPVPAPSALDWQGPSTESWDWLLGASQDTVWVVSGDRWYRGERGSWHVVGPRGEFAAAVLASDGALWVRTGEAATGSGDLIRTEGDSTRVVARDVHAAKLYAGGQGEVWLGQTPVDRVVGFRPDASRLSVAPPEGMEEVCLRGAASDGSLWVTELFEEEGTVGCDAGFTWAQWDGQEWERIQLPGSMGGAYEGDPSFPHFVENVGWAWTGPGEGPTDVLTRYAAGRESAFVASSALVPFWSAAPDGGTCGFEFRDARAYDNGEEPRFIVCFDEAGESARFDVAGLGLTDFSVAPDGSVWVKSDKVARLPVPVR